MSLDGFSKKCIQKLDFLHSLEEAQKFVVVEPQIIMLSQKLYGVENDFSVSFGPKPKLNNNKKSRAGEGAKD